VTLTDELEALLEAHMARLETPPSLNVLMQAALRSYLGGLRPSRRGRARGEASVIREEPSEYEAGTGRTSIELDPETERALRQAAAREGITTSALAAAVLQQYARGVGRPAPRGIGAYRSGRSDVASRAEEILRSAARKPHR
jgi:hypothetical protein